ncbi:LysR substrate binding domain [Peptoniphilus sp. ING2-D1G]|nr:LysR substrate binding domain [Peptoniphilus sp. ING2-D1G]
MNIEDMKYIIEISKEQSITRAALKLYSTQPALSRKIQNIEKELNCSIFLRTEKGVQLTEEGKVFLDFANKTINNYNSMHDDILRINDPEYGNVSIGFTGTQAIFVLPHFLPKFKAENPHFTIKLIEGTSDEIEGKISEGEINIGIIHNPILNLNLDFFELSHDEMVIVPRKESNYLDFLYIKNNKKYIDLNFFKDEPVVLTETRQRSRLILDKIFDNAKITPKVKQITKNLSTLNTLSLIDYSTVMLPEKQISILSNTKEYYYIDEKYNTPYSFFVATLSDNNLSPSTQKLKAFLKAHQYSF